MSFYHKFFSAILPRRLFEAMEADSRTWMVRCSCGFSRSVWEMGGIRYKAIGEPRWYLRCTGCGRRSWHTVSREQSPPADIP